PLWLRDRPAAVRGDGLAGDEVALEQENNGACHVFCGSDAEEGDFSTDLLDGVGVIGYGGQDRAGRDRVDPPLGGKAEGETAYQVCERGFGRRIGDALPHRTLSCDAGDGDDIPPRGAERRGKGCCEQVGSGRIQRETAIPSSGGKLFGRRLLPC